MLTSNIFILSFLFVTPTRGARIPFYDQAAVVRVAASVLVPPFTSLSDDFSSSLNASADAFALGLVQRATAIAERAPRSKRNRTDGDHILAALAELGASAIAAEIKAQAVCVSAGKVIILFLNIIYEKI